MHDAKSYSNIITSPLACVSCGMSCGMSCDIYLIVFTIIMVVMMFYLLCQHTLGIGTMWNNSFAKTCMIL